MCGLYKRVVEIVDNVVNEKCLIYILNFVIEMYIFLVVYVKKLRYIYGKILF